MSGEGRATRGGRGKPGGILSPANPLFTQEELARQLRTARARFLIAAPVFLERARAAARATNVEAVFVLGDADGATPLDSLFRDEDPPDIAIDPANDVVVLPFSSGTTVEFCDSIPTSASGKILRRVLVAEERARP